MDKQVIGNALGGLEKLLGSARDGLRQIEADEFGYAQNEEGGFFQDPRGALGAYPLIYSALKNATRSDCSCAVRPMLNRVL
jgi:hypothetical protein